MRSQATPGLTSALRVAVVTLLAVLLLLVQALLLPIGRTHWPLRDVLPQIHPISWWALLLVATLSAVALAWTSHTAHAPPASYLLTIDTAFAPALVWVFFDFGVNLGKLVFLLPLSIIVLIVGAMFARSLIAWAHAPGITSLKDLPVSRI